MVRIDAAQHQRDQRDLHRSDERREQQLIRHGGDRRGVVHDPIHGIADALVVERGHRQRLDPAEQVGAVVVVQRLRQPDRPAVLDQAKEAAREAPAQVRQVLGARGAVLAAAERPLGDVALGAGVSEAAHQDHQHEEHERGPGQDLDRTGVAQQVHERCDEAGVGRRVRSADRAGQDHVIDQDLERPGKQDERQQAAECEHRLHAEARPEGRDVAHGARERAQGAGGRERRGCLAHDCPAARSGRASSSSTIVR